MKKRKLLQLQSGQHIQDYHQQSNVLGLGNVSPSLHATRRTNFVSERKKKVLEEIREISEKIKQNRKAVNQLDSILDYLNPEKKEEYDILLCAMNNLTRSFVHLLFNFSHQRVFKAISVFKKMEVIEEKYIYFVYERVLCFSFYCLYYLSSTEPSIQVAALESIFSIAQIRCLEFIKSSLILKTVKSIVYLVPLSSSLLRILIQTYLTKHGDLLLTFISCLKKILHSYLKKPESTKGKVKQVVKNSWSILRDVPVPTPQLFKTKFFTPATKEDSQTLFTKKKDHSSTSLVSSFSDSEIKVLLAKLKRKLNQSILIFLRLPLPRELFKTVLVRIHVDVFPKLTQPVALCDFLIDSYNTNGIFSILALNGIFILMTKYHLDYPKFYSKLYQLFTPTIYYMKYRSDFFRLSSLFLSSRYIPASILTAFIKRMARLSLRAPLQPCLCLLAMSYNMMIHHPGCRVLLHREREAHPSIDLERNNLMRRFSESLSPTLSEVASNIQEKEKHQISQLRVGDLFREDATLPEGANALESSLWELIALRDHYCPTIAQFVRMFDKSNENPRPVELNSIVLNSYSSLIETELKKQVKNVPLEHKVVNDEDCYQAFSPNNC